MDPNSPEPEWLTKLAPPLELKKAQRKSLASIGHLVVKFIAACDRLRAKVSDGFMPELQPWLHPLADIKPRMLIGDGLIVGALQPTAGKFQLYPVIHPAPQAATAVEIWKRVFQDKAHALPPLLPFAETSVNSPLWLALLHLRPLRDFWERELRRSTVDGLLDILPKAWLFDPAPLPPGAVIPGLEIASWSELEALRESNRTFILTPVTDPPSLHQDLDDTINHAARPPKILIELSASTSDSIPFISLFSLYNKTATRVDWLGAVAFTYDGTHHHLHRIE